jgi:hypothetical protein
MHRLIAAITRKIGRMLPKRGRRAADSRQTCGRCNAIDYDRHFPVLSENAAEALPKLRPTLMVARNERVNI